MNSDKIAVKPARKGMNLSHPIEGELPDGGGLWPADQFTFSRLRDKDIRRSEEESEQPPPKPKATAKPKASARLARKGVKSSPAAAPEAEIAAETATSNDEAE